MVADGLQAGERATATVHASALPEARGQVAMHRSETLTSASLARIPLPRPARPGELVGFRVEGVIDGEQVAAHLRDGQLECDESLRDRALFLVDLREELVYSNPPRRFEATLDGRPVVVALTLLRACDRVVAFEFDLP